MALRCRLPLLQGILPAASHAVQPHRPQQPQQTHSTRTFIGTLFGSAPPSSGLQVYKERRLIGYSRAQMYALVTDIPEYKTFVPWCISSRILSTAKSRLPGDRLQTTLTGELGVGFQMFKETYVSTVRCVDKDYAVEAVASNSAVFKTLVNRWTFEGVPADQAGVLRGPPGGHRLPVSSSPLPSASRHGRHHGQPTADPSLRQPEQAEQMGQPPTVENACVIDFYVGFEFRHALYAQASALFLEQVSQMMVSSFEQRALVVYGRPSRRSLKL